MLIRGHCDGLDDLGTLLHDHYVTFRKIVLDEELNGVGYWKQVVMVAKVVANQMHPFIGKGRCSSINKLDKCGSKSKFSKSGSLGLFDGGWMGLVFQDTKDELGYRV